jgi:hypothetical protein
VTHSLWGGWHHVEVHKKEWWLYKFTSFGFIYSPELTMHIRNLAMQERRDKVEAPNGDTYAAMHIYLNMLVFINPMVASLPQHAHLFAEPGCFDKYGKSMNKEGKLTLDPTNPVVRDCGTKPNETPLPPQFQPLVLTADMDQVWVEIVKRNIKNTTSVQAKGKGKDPQRTMSSSQVKGKKGSNNVIYKKLR